MNSILSAHIAEKLRTIRLEKGLTQAELAECIGVNRNTLALWETGRRVPSAEAVKQLCKYFKVSAYYFCDIYRDSERPEKSTNGRVVPSDRT